ILVDAKNRMYFGSRDDKFYALDSSGNELFSYMIGNDVESSPTLSPKGVVYFGTDWGKLHAIR
ncbi:PQQ-binding-like beta-propeller repeat protein, partial [Myxococcota bacterium]|nr:PQQ-binding-like beta-propeller repeat protein [Myxococcota bacterium]